ncbi:MAG: hypothetical protein ACHQNT_12800 [Bacteroidia bacterium]
MSIKKVSKLVSARKVFTMLFLVSNFYFSGAQDINIGPDNIPKIIEKIKNSYELDKLNECRIKLRNIDFSELSRNEQEQYAMAYHELAYAYRNHRWVRPAFDIYQKYIALRDTILMTDKITRMQEIESKNKTINNRLLNEISEKEKIKQTLLDDKAAITGMKKKYRIWTIVLTILAVAAFIYFLTGIDRKYRILKISKEENRKQILSVSRAAWKGQMSAGALNRISYLNKLVWEQTVNSEQQLADTEIELRAIKETGGLIKNIKDDISRMKQLSEIISKEIEKIMQEIPVLKPKMETVMPMPETDNSDEA